MNLVINVGNLSSDESSDPFRTPSSSSDSSDELPPAQRIEEESAPAGVTNIPTGDIPVTKDVTPVAEVAKETPAAQPPIRFHPLQKKEEPKEDFYLTFLKSAKLAKAKEQ